MASRGGTRTTDNQTKEDLNGMKLYMALAVWMFAAPAWATCGVGGYWGSECGPKAALSYLANVDPNVRRALLANGLAEKPSQRRARLAADAKNDSAQQAPTQTVRCPEGSTWDGKGCWAMNLKAVRR